MIKNKIKAILLLLASLFHYIKTFFTNKFYPALYSFLKSVKLERVNMYVQILAICSAGIWALFFFVIKESPSLFRTNSTEVSISIDSLDNNDVIVEFIANIKNAGKQEFIIDSIFIEYWLVPIEYLKNISYFSVPEYMNFNNPNYILRETKNLGEYSIEDEFSQSYIFRMAKAPDKMLLMRIRYFLKIENIFSSDHIDGYYYTYKYRCAPDQ